MKTHNRNIYHCLACGNVVHADVGVRPPECCGYEMAKAAAETICAADAVAENVPGEIETATPLATIRTKPR